MKFSKSTYALVFGIATIFASSAFAATTVKELAVEGSNKIKGSATLIRAGKSYLAYQNMQLRKGDILAVTEGYAVLSNCPETRIDENQYIVYNEEDGCPATYAFDGSGQIDPVTLTSAPGVLAVGATGAKAALAVAALVTAGIIINNANNSDNTPASPES